MSTKSTASLVPHRKPFQFSVRSTLWLLVLASIVAWIFRQATQGNAILLALAWLFLMAASFFLLCMLGFLIGWLPAVVARRRAVVERDDPYGVYAKPPKLPARGAAAATARSGASQGTDWDSGSPEPTRGKDEPG